MRQASGSLVDGSQLSRESLHELISRVPESQRDKTMLVVNKMDLTRGDVSAWADIPIDCMISAKSGENINVLLDKTEKKQGDWEQSDFSARERHLHALESFNAELTKAMACLSCQMDLAAEDLRSAQAYLSVITGAYHSEDLLDSIFGTFCLGK